ncbi:hypothetical protein P1X14_02045 [Sphingomonas sp. AOB5]|uniref:hypothetical protein n=1 Tax=Sphingomonas sp. AOB5 TaxID=3034017 RepID=UPI0023F9AAAA|nr:hypothetical protein [Sphingomonas sp. AOB5]MDF7774015.1 hypothetical protein [Sphingomonas sp. AOB5]
MRWILLAAALAAAAPAQAADIATIGCITQSLTPAGRTTIDQAFEKSISDPSNGSPDPAAYQLIDEAVTSCAAKHGWSQKAKSSAFLHAMATLMWPVAARVGRTKGLDAAALESLFMAMPETDRLKAISAEGQPDTAIFTRLAESASKNRLADDSNAVLAGMILGIVALRERGAADFKAN